MKMMRFNVRSGTHTPIHPFRIDSSWLLKTYFPQRFYTIYKHPWCFAWTCGVVKKSRYRGRHAKPSAAAQHIYKQQRETAALLGSSTPFYSRTWCFIPPKLNIPDSQTGLSPTAPRRRCTTPTTTQLCSPLYLPLGRPLLVPRQTLSDEDTYLVPPTPSTPSRDGLSSHMPWRSGSRRPAVLFLA
jgi:hypothetical protein